MAIKFVDNFEGHVILTLEPGILLGEACDISRENLCNVLTRSYKGWELKRKILSKFQIKQLLLIILNN